MRSTNRISHIVRPAMLGMAAAANHFLGKMNSTSQDYYPKKFEQLVNMVSACIKGVLLDANVVKLEGMKENLFESLQCPSVFHERLRQRQYPEDIIKNICVTRRPQDFMYSQSAYDPHNYLSDSCGHCFGVVIVSLGLRMTFEPLIDRDQFSELAIQVQKKYEWYESFKAKNRNPVKFDHFDPDEIIFNDFGLIVSDKVTVDGAFSMIHFLELDVKRILSEEKKLPIEIIYDVKISSAHHGAVVVELTENGKIRTAIIDANRGIRREYDLDTLSKFFIDFKKELGIIEKYNDPDPATLRMWCTGKIKLTRLVRNLTKDG